MPGGIGPNRQNKNYKVKNFKKKVKNLRKLIGECDRKIVSSDKELESIKENIVKQRQLIANAEKTFLTLNEKFGDICDDKELSLTLENRKQYEQELNKLIDEHEKEGGRFAINELVLYNGGHVGRIVEKPTYPEPCLIIHNDIDKDTLELYYFVMCECSCNKGNIIKILDNPSELKLYGEFAIGDIIMFKDKVATIVGKKIMNNICPRYNTSYYMDLVYTIEFDSKNRLDVFNNSKFIKPLELNKPICDPITYIVSKKFLSKELLIYKDDILKVINEDFGENHSLLCKCLEGEYKGLQLSISTNNPCIDIYGRFSIGDIVIYLNRVATVVDKTLAYPTRILYTIELLDNKSISHVYNIDLSDPSQM